MSKTSQTRRAAMVTSSALSPNSSAEPRGLEGLGKS
jgi:hypothetical protein